MRGWGWGLEKKGAAPRRAGLTTSLRASLLVHQDIVTVNLVSSMEARQHQHHAMTLGYWDVGGVRERSDILER